MGGNVVINNANELCEFSKAKLSKGDGEGHEHFKRTIILENEILHD